MYTSPAIKRGAGHIQHQREPPKVELAVPETDSKQRLENVVFQRDGRGTGEQQHESVENQTVRAAPLPGRGGRWCGGSAPRRASRRTLPKTALERERRAATILADLHIDAVEKYRYRGVTQQVEEPHLGCLRTPRKVSE